MGVLVFTGGWWALVQVDRASALLNLSYAVSPSLVHATVMTFGFIPLFFTGFLFTAGPKWLGVRALEAPQLRAPLVLLAVRGLWVRVCDPWFGLEAYLALALASTALAAASGAAVDQ